MTNAEKFKQEFGIYATELWAKSESEFLEWFNEELTEPPTIPCFAESAEAYKAWTGEEMGGTSDLVRREDAIFTVLLCSRIKNLPERVKWERCSEKINELPTVSADIAFIPVPKNCAECWEKCLHVAVDCNAKGDCGFDGDKRREDCPIARPHGEWEDGKWCSICGCGIPTDVWGGGLSEEEAHYCVNCGAKMGGDGE